MLEMLILSTLAALFMIFLRPGKIEPLKNPLVVNRVGQFQALLAPMLNLAQPLLENVSLRLAEADRKSGDTAPLYFTVQDRNVRAHGEDFYLLAAALRNGVLYFQATAPQDGRSHLDTLRAFSDAELSHHPATDAHSDAAQTALAAAIRAAADERGVAVVPL